MLSTFPSADKFKDGRWKAYQEYLLRLKGYAETKKKCEELTSRVQDRLQLEGNRIISVFDPDFQVTVSVICTPIPKC